MHTDSQTNPEKMAAPTTKRTTATSPRRSPTTTASTATTTTADVQSWWQNMVRMVREQPYSLHYGLAMLFMLLSFFSLRLLNPAYPVPKPGGVVLVTGTSSGIGREITNVLSKQGYHVFAGVRRQESLDRWNTVLKKEEEKAKEHKEQPPYRRRHIVPIMLDVTSSDHIKKAAKQIEGYLKKHDLPFAGVVHNAGKGYHMPLEFHDVKDVQEMFAVNLLGPLELTQKLLPIIRDNQSRIVFISSLAGRITQPKEGVYSATKHGVESFGDALRQELFPYKCSVSLVEPGFVQTPILSKILDSEALGNSTAAAKIYERLYTPKYFDIFEQGVDRGGHVNQPARKVLEALTASRPKTRYPTTNFMSIPTWLVVRAKQILPDRIMDKIVT